MPAELLTARCWILLLTPSRMIEYLVLYVQIPSESSMPLVVLVQNFSSPVTAKILLCITNINILGWLADLKNEKWGIFGLSFCQCFELILPTDVAFPYSLLQQHPLHPTHPRFKKKKRRVKKVTSFVNDQGPHTWWWAEVLRIDGKRFGACDALH